MCRVRSSDYPAILPGDDFQIRIATAGIDVASLSGIERGQRGATSGIDGVSCILGIERGQRGATAGMDVASLSGIERGQRGATSGIDGEKTFFVSTQ